MSTNKHFGEYLSRYIETKGINAGKIAKKLNMTYNGFTFYYKSKNPRPETQEKILNVLGISLDELFNEQKEVNDDIVDYKTKYQQALIRENELLKEIAELRKEKIKTLEAERIEGGNPVTN